MRKLTSKDFYIVIRSSNERSLPLCEQSVEAIGVDYEVINVSPFWKAVIKTFKIGIKKDRAFAVGLDADVVLFKSAVEIFSRVIDKKPGCWRYDFRVKDRFFPTPIWRGVHVYDTTILPVALKSCPKNIEKIPKPEQEFYYMLKEKGYPAFDTTEIAGKHGYDQYYQDIFNRFLHRAVRNPEYKERLFKSLDWLTKDPEFLMVYLGWQEGEAFRRRYRLKMKLKRMLFKSFFNKRLSERIFFPKDFRKKRNIQKYLKKYGLDELEPL